MIRPDMEDLAKDLGCAPTPAQRTVEINDDNARELMRLAKKESTSLQVLVNEILACWLMRV